MNSVIMITQFFFTLVIGMYFFTKLRNEKSDSETLANNSKKEAEHLNCMRHIHLSEPVTETARPKNVNEIIGQDDGIRAIKAALCGPDIRTGGCRQNGGGKSGVGMCKEK